MKLLDIDKAVPALQKLSDLPLPYNISYRLTKIFARLQTDVDYLSKERLKIFQKYGERQDGDTYTLHDPTNRKAAQKELSKLFDVDVDLKITPLKVPIDRNFKLSVNDILSLSKFIIFT
jgi:hypothetical protein